MGGTGVRGGGVGGANRIFYEPLACLDHAQHSEKTPSDFHMGFGQEKTRMKLLNEIEAQL